MPEGDTIFRTAHTLHLALSGREVLRFETAFAHLQRVHDQEPVTGRCVESVTARGKHVVMTFSGGLVLRTHMRMSGSWHVYRPGERWQLPRGLMRVIVATEAFEAVAFSVHDAEWTSTDHLRRGAIGRLGPDLLAEAFDETEALRRLRARNADAIGLVLLDQRVVAGIGNVYKSEVLFLARVHPWTLVRDLDDGALSAVLAVGRRLLSANARPARGASLPAYGGER
ncbi:MAG: hypothetical protein MUF60_05390, partial [Vicinamibacterales bacterium]|nr:hypothetical protein [Vicinamibacterales bacterium]